MPYDSEKAPLAQSDKFDNTDEWLSVLTSAEQHGLIEADRAGALRGRLALDLLPPDDLAEQVAALLPAGPAANRALDFLELLFRPDDVIELRTFDAAGGGARSLNGRLGNPTERAEMGAFITQNNGRKNLYYGVNVRRADLAGTSAAASAADVDVRRVAVLDFDRKDAPDVDPDWSRTLGGIRGVTDVTAVIDTGNGLHVVLPLKDGDTTDVAVSALNAAMVRVGSDKMADAPRVARLPYTVNLPNDAKRKRGNAPVLATLRQGAQGASVCNGPLPIDDLCAALFGVVDRLALPGKLGAAGATSAPAATGGGTKTPHAAPSADLLRMAVAALPNNGPFDDRADWVKIGMAIKGAAIAGGFEDVGRDVWLEWCGRFHLGGDPVEDGRVWDTLAGPHVGWGTLLAALERTNLAGHANVKEAEAKRIFTQDPDEVREFLNVMGSKALSGMGTNATVQSRSAAGFELAVQKILAGGGRVFTDQKGNVWLKYDSRLMNVSGKDQRLFQLARRLGANLTATARNSFIETLLNRAEADAPKEHVGYRQAEGNNGSDPVIYVNRMDGANGVEISRVGWRDVPLSSIPQPMADRQGGLAIPPADSAATAIDLMPLLERHLPLEGMGIAPSANDKGVAQRAMILCLLASAYYRPGTVPHFMVSGQQGSGKTTMAKRLMDLMDADVAAITTTLPRTAGDMFAVVSGRGVVTIDNAGGLTKDTSDALCALASGSAFAGRKLYANGERHIMDAKASVIFTSVLSDVVKQPDLAQRTLQFEPSPINLGARRSERDMDADWMADLPKLLGALFSALSGMLKELPAVEADVKAGRILTPRLHDAAIAAEAIARAIGWPNGQCMAALLSAETGRAGDLLEDNPVAWRIRKFVQNCPNAEWEGTFGELHMAIQYISAVDAPAWDQKRVPFSGQYQRLWPDLELAWGIKRTLGRSNKTRTIRLIAPKPPSE